jgi:hypothetical protein
MGQNMNEFTLGAMGLTATAAIVLGIAGVKVALNRETRGRGVLMVIAAVVLALNVAIWTI